MHPGGNTPSTQISRPVRLGGLAICLAILAGCTTTVPIETNIPTPLIAPMPVRVAVFYDPSLTDFEHTEDIVGASDWVVQLGNANMNMFNKLFASMFATVVKVDSLEQAFADSEGYDAIITPSIVELQIAPPSRLESDFFEAWVKYRIDAFDNDQKPIVKWVVTGYGKAEPEMLGASNALSAATVTAMRDAAANIVIKFKKQPRVREWIDEQERLNGLPAH